MSDALGSANRNDDGAAWPQRLRAERERRGLDRQQVADDLHVDVRTIEALEAGQFASLGPPVYARGHLRRYAELLGLDAAELVSAFERQSAQPPELVPIVSATPPRAELPVGRVAAAVVAVIVVGAGWWAFSEREVRVAVPAPKAESTRQAGVVEAVEPNAPDATEPTVAGTEEASTTIAPRSAEETAADAEPRGTPVRLRLNFSADSWVELYDAGGQRIFFDLGPANSVRSFTAAAPLRVLLGYADGVQLELNGQPVTLPSHVRQGNLARFTVDARGQVRPAEG